MNVLIFGIGGFIGREIAEEAGSRGHFVTAAVRDPSRLTDGVAADEVVAGDVTDASQVTALVAGKDAVLSAIGPGSTGDATIISRAADALIAGISDAGGTRRIIFVGGAGTLEISPGVERLDAPGYPEQYRAYGMEHRKALASMKACNLDWTYVSPPVVIAPGERRGHYRVGGDAVLYDADGMSAITASDYAVAFIDQLEKPTALRRRITVAY